MKKQFHISHQDDFPSEMEGECQEFQLGFAYEEEIYSHKQTHTYSAFSAVGCT